MSASGSICSPMCKSAKSGRRYEFLHYSSSEPLIRLPILHLQYQWLPHWPLLTPSNGPNTLCILLFGLSSTLTASDLFISLFALSSPFSCSRQHCNFVLLHTPLPFISPNASSCASPHWLGSKAGWIATMVSVRSRVPVPPQSKHSTASFFSASPPCFHFVLALSFKSISWLSPSLLYKLLLCCLFSDLPHCLCCSQTHWLWTGLTLNPDFYSLYAPFSFLWPLKLTSASRLYCSGWSKTPHPGSVLADTEQSLSTTERS